MHCLLKFKRKLKFKKRFYEIIIENSKIKNLSIDFNSWIIVISVIGTARNLNIAKYFTIQKANLSFY